MESTPSASNVAEPNMLHDIQVEHYVKDTVTIEPEGIEEEYIRMPADLAYWCERYARALRAHLEAKHQDKNLRALLAIEHRERLHEALLADQQKEKSKSGSGRVTDSQVNVAVETDERCEDMQARLVGTEVEMVRVKGILEAVRAKKDMLMSLGAHIRAEMDGDPVVRAAHADARRFRK